MATDSAAAGSESGPLAICQVTDPDDPRIAGMHALMARTFEPGESDTEDITRAELRDHPGRHLVFVAYDPATGAVVGYATGALLALRAADGAEVPGLAFVCGCYLDRDPRHGGHRLGERLFQLRLDAAQCEAVRRGVDVVGYLAECSEKEAFFNKMGARRLYARSAPDCWEELPYRQPPTAWDAHGHPLPPASAPGHGLGPPEHLMFTPAYGQPVPPTLAVEQVLQMVRGMFWYNARENHFLTDGTPESLGRLHATVDAFERELEAFCRRGPDGLVYLLSREERENLRAGGTTVVEHRTADRRS